MEWLWSDGTREQCQDSVTPIAVCRLLRRRFRLFADGGEQVAIGRDALMNRYDAIYVDVQAPHGGFRLAPTERELWRLGADRAGRKNIGFDQQFLFA